MTAAPSPDRPRLALAEVGHGPAMLFQHGLCGDARQPADVFPSDAFRCLTVECRGHGGSEPGDPEAFGIASFADDVADTLDGMRLGPLPVGGISMGAAIALRLAVRRPDLVSALVLAMLGLDAVMKLAFPQLMIDHSPPLGLANDVGLYRMLGATLLAAIVLHLVPRTAFLGAILITAFLGGAIAINLRAGMPFVSNTLFGFYLGAFLWLGYWLRDMRVRALLS